MVDTINPQTGQSDSFQPEEKQAAVSDSFYSGFGKPDDVRVNLASTQPASVESVTAPTQSPTTQPTESNFPEQTAPVQTPSVTNQAYSTKSDPLNTRLLLVSVVAGLVFMGLAGTAAYFITTSSNKNKLETEKEDLQALQDELKGLETEPDKLELPKQPPAPVTNTETPVAPVVEEAPLETPTPQSTRETDGMG